jgi:hypothetical protein
MKVIICKPAKSATQSGKAKNKKWLITLAEEKNTRQINPLMGWTSSNNTKTQLKFFFSTKEEAINYAKGEGFEYEIIEPNDSTVKQKSYAENFTN